MMSNAYHLSHRSQRVTQPSRPGYAGQFHCSRDVAGLRDQVLLKPGDETMRRRSEPCSLRFEDVNVYPNGQPCIRLRFSRSD